MHITRPYSMPKDSSSHHLSFFPPEILASSGTPSTSFYIVNLFLDCHPALTLNLSPPCLPISFPTKYSNFIRLSSRILPILHLIFNHVTFLLISRSSSVFLEKNSLSSYLGHPCNTFCYLDPIPTSILKQCLPILLPL